MENINLLAGKSVALSFRAPVDVALKIMQCVEQRESNISALTLQLWEKELGVKREVTQNGNSNG